VHTRIVQNKLHEVSFGKKMTDDGRAYGFDMDGTTATVSFAKAIFLETPEIRAGTRMVIPSIFHLPSVQGLVT